MRDVTLLSMKNKSVQNCRFVHHAKFHFIMTTLNKLFKIEFERWGGNWKGAETGTWVIFHSHTHFKFPIFQLSYVFLLLQAACFIGSSAPPPSHKHRFHVVTSGFIRLRLQSIPPHLSNFLFLLLLNVFL